MTSPPGRWPSNVILSHHDRCWQGECVDGCPVAELDKQSGPAGSVVRFVQQPQPRTPEGDSLHRFGIWGGPRQAPGSYGDTGGASRFFPTFHPHQVSDTQRSPTVNRLLHGDCLDALRTLDDCSVDAVVTDPPAGIAFMGKAWDGNRGGRDQWVAWLSERLEQCLRVLKPGGHAVVWALPRTSGWTHRALEDAGFEVRDCITHLFGSGFPKSLDVGKAIDKAAGIELTVIGMTTKGLPPGANKAVGHGEGTEPCPATAPTSELGRRWGGWGTALKPAAEFWYLARRPLDSTVAGSVCRWGTGALNVDACRVGTTEPIACHKGTSNPRVAMGDGWHDSYQPGDAGKYTQKQGRWPANVALTHPADCADGGCVDGCPVAELDRQSGILSVSGAYPRGGTHPIRWGESRADGENVSGYPDRGGASRFFPTFKYQAKPSTREKNTGLDGLPEGPPVGTQITGGRGRAMTDLRMDRPQERRPTKNTHPTVKPVELMRWLTRLITPPGGTVLDPFAGSGTTLVAATLEGFDTVGIEAEADYLPIIQGRVRWAESQCEQQALGFG